jgi:hypothetical protein
MISIYETIWKQERTNTLFVTSQTSPFPYSANRVGSIRGMASAHPPNGVVEDEGKAKAFGLVEALLFTTSKLRLSE